MPKKQRKRLLGLAQKVKHGNKSFSQAVHILVDRGLPYNVALNAMSRMVKI